MTQFISSFLIEPVVRQARRFSSSRVSNEEEDEDDPQPPPRRDDLFPEFHDDLQSPPPELQEEAFVTSEELDITSQRGTGDQGPDTEASADADIDGRPRANHSSDHSPAQGNLQLAAIGETQTEEPRTRAETDPNPQSAAIGQNNLVRQRFRSTTGSYSTSINEAGIIRSGSLSGTSSRAVGSGRTGTGISAMDYIQNSKAEGTLPEDDGMSLMRKRIVEIQNLDAPASEKSRLMHTLMTEQYSLGQHLQSPSKVRPISQGSLKSQDRPTTPSSAHTTLDISQVASPVTSRSSVGDDMRPLTTSDLSPTFWVPSTRISTAPSSPQHSRRVSLDVEEEEKMFGCKHYKRNVKLQCYACSKWYTCRFCHDEIEDHLLNRRETRNMLCMFCGSAQPAAGQCRDCGEIAADYYCNICKLWDNDPSKSIYHCDDCGICRVGRGLGKDFYHCKTCNVCLAIAIADTHRCIERSTDCDCPICGEYMFTSLQTVVFMRCGHSIHRSCYKEHMQSSFKCPICSRSIINMEMTFRSLDRAIESQPMPSQFQDTKAFVYCNDCSAKSSVKYHWLGLKCAVCDSYNTAQLQILSDTDIPTEPHEQSATITGNAATNGAETTSGLDLQSSQHLSGSRGRLMANLSGQTSRAISTDPHVPLSSYLAPWPPLDRNIRARSEDGIASNTRGGRGTLENGPGDDPDEMDTDEDSVDFWGGSSVRSGNTGRGGDRTEGPEESSDETDSDVDMLVEEEDDDDDDDDDGELVLIGHR